MALTVCALIGQQAPQKEPVGWMVWRRVLGQNALHDLGGLYERQRQPDLRTLPGFLSLNKTPLLPADFATLRGILALETGHPTTARDLFRAALSECGPELPGLHFLGEPAARGYGKMLERAR